MIPPSSLDQPSRDATTPVTRTSQNPNQTHIIHSFSNVAIHVVRSEYLPEPHNEMRESKLPFRNGGDGLPHRSALSRLELVIDMIHRGGQGLDQIYTAIKVWSGSLTRTSPSGHSWLMASSTYSEKFVSLRFFSCA